MIDFASLLLPGLHITRFTGSARSFWVTVAFFIFILDAWQFADHAQWSLILLHLIIVIVKSTNWEVSVRLWSSWHDNALAPSASRSSHTDFLALAIRLNAQWRTWLTRNWVLPLLYSHDAKWRGKRFLLYDSETFLLKRVTWWHFQRLKRRLSEAAENAVVIWLWLHGQRLVFWWLFI